MPLKSQIQKDIVTALKAKEELRLSTLRFLNAQIQNKEIEKKRQEISDEELIQLINNQIKKLKENLELYQKNARNDLIEKTNQEVKILSAYLPQSLSDEELEAEIDKIIAENPNLPHPGALIGIAVKKLGPQADNAKIAQLIKEKTSSG